MATKTKALLVVLGILLLAPMVIALPIIYGRLQPPENIVMTLAERSLKRYYKQDCYLGNQNQLQPRKTEGPL